MRTGVTLALAVALLVAGVVAGVHLYRKDPAPDAASDDGGAAVWNGYRVVGRGIVVEKITNPCTDIADIAVEETKGRVVVTVFVESDAAVCSELAVTRRTLVELADPLGDRAVFDGGCLDRGEPDKTCRRRTVGR